MMKYKFTATLESNGTSKCIGEIGGKDKFVPSEVEKDLENLCLPWLNALAGSSARVVILGSIRDDNKAMKLGVMLAAAEPEGAWRYRIKQLTRSFRNWIFKEFQPEYKAVL